MKKAQDIYNRAQKNGVYFENTCVSLPGGYDQWQKLMKGATRANNRIVTKLAVQAGAIEPDLVKYYNPYNHFKTKTHLIYVHSGIEHFLRIN